MPLLSFSSHRGEPINPEETHDGELVEVSKNYFAICNRTNAVFYFGKDVDIYEGGVIIGHEGSWLAGVGGARAGIVMPGDILNGAQYYQEVAPLVALDRALIQGTNFTVDTPAGTFTNCLKTVETTPLEPDAIECKFYAREIGIVMDGVLKLTTYSPK